MKVVTDSTSYIENHIKTSLDIYTVNLSVNFPDESLDETKVSYDYFYDKIDRENIIPTSSQPTLGQIFEVFRTIIRQGHEVLAIFISAQMSGTYLSAISAKQMILQEYPEARIEIIDSKTNCMALGIQVIEAAKAAINGLSMEDIIEKVLDLRDRIHFYFVPATLKYLIKGGRIGGASALIGPLLKITPILFVNNGQTDVFERLRGTKKAVERMILKLQQDAADYGLEHLLVHHINDEQQGQVLAERLGKLYQQNITALPIGPVIGLHVGPGTVGLVYSTKSK
ncbi:MAG: DegV family protein [Syntrophomonadaceae bacterium]